MAREVVTGYCWPQSVGAGEQVGLHMSSSGGRPVRVEVARVGARREVVFSSDAVATDEHETPKDAASKGCGWPVALTLDVDPTWRSGYYEVVMEIDVGEKVRRDYAFFVVRPSAGARIVLALATNTWHAYNDFGGPNLYTGGTHVAMQRPMAAGYLYKPPGKGRRVTGTGAPDPQNAAHVGYLQLNHLSGYAGSAGWPDWELPFIEWAEREGFEIGVCTNADLEEHPEVLDGASLYLSVGHDEYWSRGMRDTVEAFIARGGNAAFFSGNTSLWQVRIEGDDHDVMVGYKGFFKNDPLMGTDREPEVTTFWSDVVVGRPENHMTGVSFTRGGYHRIGRNVTAGLGGYTVHRAGHWIFDGTGLGYGDVLGAGATVVGYECDGCVFTYRDGLPYPTGEDGTPSTFEILGTCPTQHFTRETAPRPPKPGEPSELEYIASRVFGTREPEAMERIRHGHAVLGAYTNEAGATVVTSGSTDWAHGLAGARPADRTDHPERADAVGVATWVESRTYSAAMRVFSSAMRGVAAGVVATAAMDALWYRRYRADGGKAGFSTWEFSTPAATYDDDAPAPARVAKRIADTLNLELPDSSVATANNLVHWTTGIGWGKVAGLASAALPVPPVVVGLVTGATAWAASYAALGAAGIYKPITEYDSDTLWKDLSAHLVFGAALGAALTVIGPRRRR